MSEPHLPPTWIPKSFTPTPEGFGHDPHIPWRRPTDYPEPTTARALLLAARLQHATILALRNSPTAREDSNETDRAHRLGLTRDRWGRTARGDQPIRTDEIGLICTVYDLRLSEVLHVGSFATPRQVPTHARNVPR